MKTRLERPFHGIAGQGAGEGEKYALVSLQSGEYLIFSGPLAGDVKVNREPLIGRLKTSSDNGSTVAARHVAGPLNFQTCMAFLVASIPSDSQPVCWELDWLVAMMCKSLPRERLVELVDREGRCPPDDPWNPRPVLAHGYAFDWLPAHYFSLRTPSGRNIRISDPHRFWGRDLAEAAIAEGVWKWELLMGPQPADERLIRLAPSRSMNITEKAVLLEITMTRFRERCIEHGAVPRQWEGPGQGASKLMNTWSIKDYLSGSYVQ